MQHVFFCDLDGTLLQHNDKNKYTIDNKNIDFIKQFQELGHEFVIASGRNGLDIQSIKKHYGINTRYHISNNGGCIWENNKLINCEVIPKDVVVELLQLVVNKGYYVAVSDGFDLYIENSGQIYDDTDHSMDNPFVIVDDLIATTHKLTQIVSFSMIPCIDDTYTQTQKNKITQEWTDLCIKKYGELIDVVQSGNDISFVDVVKKGVDKATAITWLSNNVDVNWVTHHACGDAMNDYQMIKKANYGFAIKSNHKLLKEVAYREINHVHELFFHLQKVPKI